MFRFPDFEASSTCLQAIIFMFLFIHAVCNNLEITMYYIALFFCNWFCHGIAKGGDCKGMIAHAISNPLTRCL